MINWHQTGTTEDLAHFNILLVKIYRFSFREMHSKLSSAKYYLFSRPQCVKGSIGNKLKKTPKNRQTRNVTLPAKYIYVFYFADESDTILQYFYRLFRNWSHTVWNCEWLCIVRNDNICFTKLTKGFCKRFTCSEIRVLTRNQWSWNKLAPLPHVPLVIKSSQILWYGKDAQALVVLTCNNN